MIGGCRASGGQLLSAPGCIANLHETTNGFSRKPVLVGLGMPIAAAFDLALLPISIPTNLVYFLSRNRRVAPAPVRVSTPPAQAYAPPTRRYYYEDTPRSACDCCPN